MLRRRVTAALILLGLGVACDAPVRPPTHGSVVVRVVPGEVASPANTSDSSGGSIVVTVPVMASPADIMALDAGRAIVRGGAVNLAGPMSTTKSSDGTQFVLRVDAVPVGSDYTVIAEGYKANEVVFRGTVTGVTVNGGTVPTPATVTNFAVFAPTNLTATGASSTQIDLAWTDVANETGYRIERCQGGTCTNFSEITTRPANTVTFQNTGLTGGATYRYRVRASDGADTSGYSNIAMAAALPLPKAPTGLSAFAVSSSQIDLSWADSSANEDGFRVERCSGSSCTSFTEIATVGPNIGSYQNAGLTASASYSYRVRAYNAGGTSGYSNTATAIASALVSSVVITPAGAAISGVGTTQGFAAEARDAGGNVIPGKTFTWASLNPNVATINSSTGLATAVSSGQVIVSATVDGKTGTAVLTVSTPGLAPINLLSMVAGSSSTTFARYAVWGASADDIHAVGRYGDSTVLRFNGTQWNPIPLPGDAPGLEAAFDIWGASPSDVYAVGSYGISSNDFYSILRFDGTTWSMMKQGTGLRLMAVWGSSPTDIFAVGHPGIMHYDGTDWTLVPGTSTHLLNSIWGSSRSDIFAVGELGKILHYDGVSWSTMNTPGIVGDICAVWGTSGSNVYAAGAGGVYRFDGTSWGGLAGPSYSGFCKISGTSSSDMWIAGSAGGGGSTLRRYDGSSCCSSVVFNHAPGFPASLQDVWRTSSGVFFAVGAVILRGYSGATVTLTPASPTLTAFGATQQMTPTARDAGNNVVSGLSNSNYAWTVAPTGVVTVNSSGLVTAQADGSTSVCATAPGGAQGCATVTVDQVAATITVTPAGAFITGTGQVLSAQAKDANGNVITGQKFTWSSLNPNVANVVDTTGAVGGVSSGQATIAASADGVKGYALVTVAILGATPVNLWTAFVSGTTEDLWRVWGLSASDVYVVGENGTRLHFNGSTWSSATTGAFPHVFGVWGAGANDVFAVGSAGTIWRLTGRTDMTPMTSPTGTTLIAIWGSSPRDVFAVGLNGVIVRYDGQAWSQMPNIPTTETLYAVWGFSPTQVYAAGDNGVILTYDGLTWTPMNSGTSASISGLWGFSTTNLYASSGTTGQLFFFSGGPQWNQAATATSTLQGLWGTWESDLYLAGGAKVHRYVGTASLEEQLAPAGAAVRSLWGASTGAMFASGSDGTLLRGYRGATVTMTPATPTLISFNATLQMTATARDAGSTVISGLSNSDYTWTVNPGGIVTVSPSGLVAAVANGTAMVVARAPGGAADSTVVTVNQQVHHFAVTNTSDSPIATQTSGVAFDVRFRAQDSLNNIVTTFNGPGNTVNLTSNSAISAGGGTTAAFVSGVLSSHSITLTTAGSRTITATRTSGGAQAGTSNTFTVNAGSPSKLGFVVQPSNTVAGTLISPAVQVAIQDAASNTVVTATTTISLAIGNNPSGGTLSGTTAVPTESVATFSNLQIDNFGSGYTLAATGGGFTAATSDPFNVLCANCWTTKPALPSARGAPGVGVINGTLYAVGGYTGSNTPISTVESYNGTGGWTARAPMPTARYELGVGVVNGILYAVGGFDGNNPLTTVEAYDPVANTWSTKKSMPTARYGLAVGVVSGVLYAVGGVFDESGQTVLETVEAYNPVSDTWSTKTSMPTARGLLGVGVVSGTLYAVGGYYPPDGEYAIVEAYNPIANTWSTKTSMPTARAGVGVEAIGGFLYAVGGSDGNAVATLERFSPGGNSWISRANMTTARYHTGVGVINGVMYVVGGVAGTLKTENEAYQP